MVDDMGNLLKLERIASRVPVVKDILQEVSDLFCPPVRVILETFKRDRFDTESTSGRRCLTTTINVMPDNKTVEDVYQFGSLFSLTQMSVMVSISV